MEKKQTTSDITNYKPLQIKLNKCIIIMHAVLVCDWLFHVSFHHHEFLRYCKEHPHTHTKRKKKKEKRSTFCFTQESSRCSDELKPANVSTQAVIAKLTREASFAVQGLFAMKQSGLLCCGFWGCVCDHLYLLDELMDGLRRWCSLCLSEA